MFSLLRRRKSSQGDQRASSIDTTICPQCGGTAAFLIASTDRNRHTTDAVFDYFRCGRCGMVFMDPIPDDLGPFYSGGYNRIPETQEEFRTVAQTERYRLDSVLPYKQSGKLLEVGPWMGLFSFNARECGFDVTTLEMDQACVDFMNTTLGIHAIQSNDPAATLLAMDEQFDVIALWHCLEHVREPWMVIRSAAKRLASGGILLIAVPNIDSFEFTVLGAGWKNLDAPRHLFFFPLKSLSALCGELGLVQRLATTSDELSQRFSAQTWHELVMRSVSIPKIKGLMWRMMKWFANRRERAENSGPGLTAVYQRPESGVSP